MSCPVDVLMEGRGVEVLGSLEVVRHGEAYRVGRRLVIRSLSPIGNVRPYPLEEGLGAFYGFGGGLLLGFIGYAFGLLHVEHPIKPEEADLLAFLVVGSECVNNFETPVAGSLARLPQLDFVFPRIRYLASLTH